MRKTRKKCLLESRMKKVDWRCRHCCKRIEAGRIYCNVRCMTAEGYRHRMAQLRVEAQGRPPLQGRAHERVDLRLRADITGAVQARRRLEAKAEAIRLEVYEEAMRDKPDYSPAGRKSRP